MELLHEWLGSTVEQELGEVLEWRAKSEVNGSQLTGMIGDLIFVDDGSNLRIRSAKKQVVQLIKFVPNQEPLQACLSDSVNRVDATISKDAVHRYTKKTGKRLTDGTLGGLIQLISFEIVATHIGSRQKRITLFVTEFKALGANGSGGYGMPRPIEDGPSIKELIQKLIQFRAQESAKRQTPSRQQYSTDSLKSQPDTIASQGNSPRDTQTMFATQAPSSKMPAMSSSNVKASSDGFPLNLRNSLSHKPLAKAHPLLHGSKLPATRAEELLSLLQPKKQLTDTKVALKEPTRPHLASDVTTSSETGTVRGQVDPLRPPHVAASKMVDEHGQRFVPASIPTPTEDMMERIVSGSAIPAEQSERNKGETMTSTRTRIRSRDVKIPKDQDKILDSADSWLPAEPGRREPVANLPISVLQSLNRKADIQAPRRVTFPTEKHRMSGVEEPQQSHRPSFNDGDLSQPESESDTPVSLSQWPPSPAGDQLPPDSSAESTDVQSNIDAHIRRSSNASLSSGLTRRRPTPLPVLRSSRNSPEPSSLAMSPSIVSNLARQGGQRQSRSDTPKSSVSRTLTPVSMGATPAISHSLGQSTFNGRRESVNRDESIGEVPAALEHTTPASIRQRSPGISEILNGLKPGHDEHLRRSSEVVVEKPPLYIDLSQEQVLSPLRASTSLEPFPLQSSWANSATEKLNGRHRRNAPSGLYSIPPSPESDLEMAAPFSLKDKATTPRESTHEPIPSTASQPTEPFTQVKRTPYVNDQIREHSPPMLERQLFISKINASHSLANDIPLEDVDHVTQSTPSILEISSSEAFTHITKETISKTFIDKASATIKAIDDQQSHIMQAGSNRERHQPEILSGGLEKNNKPEATEKMSAAASSEGEGTVESNVQGNRDKPVAHIDHETKRKALDLDFLSTNVAKRRKKFKMRRNFPLMENIENQPDPMDAARRYRQDFVISRKSGEAEKPQESPSIPVAICNVGLEKLGELHANPELEDEIGVQPEADRQPLLDVRAQVPSLHNDEAMETDLVPPKQSVSDESDQVDRLAPMAQSKSLPLNGLKEVTPDPKVKELHPAIENDSPMKMNMRKSSDFVSIIDEEDGFEDAAARAIPNATSGHTPDNDDDDASKVTPDEQSLNSGPKTAGPDLQHNVMIGLEVDDATPSVQAVDATQFEADFAKVYQLADQAMDVETDDAGPSVQRDQIVAGDAIQRPENDESADEVSGSTRSYPTYDHPTDVEAHDAKPGAQYSEAMDIQPDNLNDKARGADTAKLTRDKPDAHVNSKPLNISEDRLSSDDRKVLWTIRRQESPLPDHSESISESLNAPKPLKPGANGIGSPDTVRPVPVATDALRSNLQEGQVSESSALSMYVRPGISRVTDQPSSSAVVPARDSNMDADPQFSTPCLAEQSALPEMPSPDGNAEAAVVIVRSTAECKKPERPSAPRNIFDQFKAAYPAYPGDLKHFVAVCRKIKTLVDLGRMQHQYLWDDFIVRHKIEYAQHLRQCAEDAEDALPYEEFYKTEIPKPLYCNEVVTHRKLDEALSLRDIISSVPRKRGVNAAEILVKPTRHAPASHQEPSVAPEESSTRVQKRSKRRETIDLTLDDQGDVRVKTPEEMSITPPMSSIRKARRSLPWTEANTQPLATSPQKPERFPGGHGDLGARLRATDEASDTSTKFDKKASKRPDATTDGKGIREIWGVGAHDVLEPRYYDKISPRHLQLLKDIANMVDLEEARRLIYKKIHSRTNPNLVDSKVVTVADLEAVFDALLTKKVKNLESPVKEDFTRTKMEPPDARQSRASSKGREDERHGEWWEDDNTPFKSFAKAYKSIKPGNGNSYARDEPAKTKASASRARERDNKLVKQAIDTWNWKL